MKAISSALGLLSLTILNASADWVMQSKVESAQINTEITTKIKGDKMRTDMKTGPVGAMSTIMDAATGDTIQLMHDRKMAFSVSGAMVKQQLELTKKMARLGSDTVPEKPKATGEKAKVGEWDCEIYTWKSGDMQMKFWIATNIPNAANLKAVSEKVQTVMTGGVKMGPDESDLPGVTVKTESVGGGTKSVMTVTSIKEEALDAKIFEKPADYQTMQMPSMGAPAPAK